ncbi:hypothetical protein BGW80DRAFT_1453013 [Lactifluus volemus]|nr:hypothetical protein BGW80DRAFT_1453013 [Lactifluus volemus]
MSNLHHNSSESEPEDDNVSAYNDGKGIQISVSLVSILQPPKAGEKKRHTNAKPPITTQVVYIHKNTKLIDGLVRIIGQALNWRDLCKGGLDEHGGMEEETTALFHSNDWKTFLEEASKKATAQGKLVIREKQKVEDEILPDQSNSETSDEEDERPKKKRKKKKKHVPTDEEKNQDTIIKRLTEVHMCEDRKAAAIDSGLEGIDEQNPPNMKIFDSAMTNATADITTMVKRRAAASTKVKKVMFAYILETLNGEAPKAFFDLTKGPSLAAKAQKEKKRLAQKRNHALRRERRRVAKEAAGGQSQRACEKCRRKFGSRKAQK